MISVKFEEPRKPFNIQFIKIKINATKLRKVFFKVIPKLHSNWLKNRSNLKITNKNDFGPVLGVNSTF